MVMRLARKIGTDGCKRTGVRWGNVSRAFHGIGSNLSIAEANCVLQGAVVTDLHTHQETKATERIPAYLRPTTTIYGPNNEEEFMKRFMKPETDIYRKRFFRYTLLTSWTGTFVMLTRNFTYMMGKIACANELHLAQGNMVIPAASIPVGECVLITYQSIPTFVRHRSPEQTAAARDPSLDISTLRDPQTDEERNPHPDWAIASAVCTHLGCIPLPDLGIFGAYLCPCHGSHYDHAMRIRKGPAATNLHAWAHEPIDGGENLLIGTDATVI